MVRTRAPLFPDGRCTQGVPSNHARVRMSPPTRQSAALARDFAAFLNEIGITQVQMDAAAAMMPSPIPRQPGEGYCVLPSPIQGMGCFATRDINGLIGKMRHGNEWYEAGMYINHSPTPNAYAVVQESMIAAYGAVSAGEEITLDYRQVRKCILGDS